VQEAFIKAYRALPRFRGDSTFYTWMHRIAVNSALTYFDRRSRRIPRDHSRQDPALTLQERWVDEVTPEQDLIYRRMLETVSGAVEELPEILRVPLVMREFGGLSYRTISAQLDLPMGTVRSRLFRAREKIFERLEPHLCRTEARYS